MPLASSSLLLLPLQLWSTVEERGCESCRFSDALPIPSLSDTDAALTFRRQNTPKSPSAQPERRCLQETWLLCWVHTAWHLLKGKHR